MNDIITLLTSHNYLALALFAIVYVRKLASSDSAFPLTIPPQWNAVLTGVLAMAYGAVGDVMAHAAWVKTLTDALAIGGTTGVADALLSAVFATQTAPKWARAIVFVFDDLTGQTPPTPPTPTSKSTSIMMLLPFALVASLAFGNTSCAATQKPLPDPIPQDIQAVVACVLPLLAEGVTDPSKLEAACAPGEEQLIIDVLALLGQSKELNPAVSTTAKIAYVNGARAFLKHQHYFQLETP